MPEPRTIVVVHGRSEALLFMGITKRIRYPINVFSFEGGARAIKLEHLEEGLLSQPPFNRCSSLKTYFGWNLECKRLDEGKDDFRIFPIMDIDGDYIREKSYITGNMFRDCPFRDKIVPIYNKDNLDEVMSRCGYGDVYLRNKPYYYKTIGNRADIKELLSRLQKDEGTNLDVFLAHCMSHVPRFQSQIET